MLLRPCKIPLKTGWEKGCLHLDELIREEDVDLRRRGPKFFVQLPQKVVRQAGTSSPGLYKGEDAQVRRSASACLPTLQM
ncbi:MAG: hypothetical protein Ct9H90mP23_1550 [Methanobacteriota archaeon]|nr:MAG: hypothetical protein Ct9H90mP23_1550 [Euryarchaeota archaeon]